MHPKLAIGLLLAASWASASGASAQECPHDDALARVAADLCFASARPEPEEILNTLRAADSDRLAAHVLWLDGDEPARRAAWLRELASRSDAGLVCGEARGPDRVVLVAAVRAGALSVDEEHADRVVPWLAPGFREPYLVFRGADGALSRRGLEASDFTRGFELPADLARPATVQLVATGSSGPQPVAERRVGHAPAHAVATTGVHAGTSVPRAVAALRQMQGVSPLRPNRLLGRVAQAHAEGVCRAGRVVHELSVGEDPSERLARAGIEARVVGEAVARAESIPEALSAMADSPSHLMALVDRRFTDGGFGVAHDAQGRSCVVVLLAAWPRAVPAMRHGKGRGVSVLRESAGPQTPPGAAPAPPSR